MAPPSAEKDKPGKLYLGSLSFTTDEETLRVHFQKYGKISDVQIIKDKVTSASRGFGFVTYDNPADAEDAVLAMDGTELDGKFIKVAHALRAAYTGGDSGDRGRGRDRGRGTRGGFGTRGRGRGGPPMERGRGRGGSFRGRGALPRGGPRAGLLGRGGRGDEDYLGEREPLLSTPPEADYGMDDNSLYARAAPRMKGSRPSAYGREDDLERDTRHPTSVYERPSRFESDVTERTSRPLSSYGRQSAGYDGIPAEREARMPSSSSYGREPDGYGSLPSERASRAPLSSYGRDPPAYRREASGFGREASSYDRTSSYPTERESAAVPRRAALDDPYAGNSREPALSDYPSSRPTAREFPTERTARADPYARDPYAAGVREPATAREYGERSRELPTAARERDAYPVSRGYPAAAREATARPAYPSARGLEPREYERPMSREYPAERNGSYSRERETRDPYGSAASARYESYPTRDAYASTARTEKAAYGARDPYGASVSGRSARLEGAAPSARSGGYARR